MATKTEGWSADAFQPVPAADFVERVSGENTKVIYTRVPVEVHRLVKSKAALAGMTIEELAREAIREFLEKNDCKGPP